MKSLRNVAFVTAGFAYAVIVIGFIVRITESGMGCGPDWPLCNGAVIPTFTSSEVVIEWTHRVAVLALSGLILAVLALVYARRRDVGGSGPGGTLTPAIWLAGLFLLQSYMGRQAVRLELESLTVVVHLGLALALLALLVVLGLRARVHAGTITRGDPARGRGGAMGAVVMGAVVLLLGGLTANMGATGACVGFPLCSGQLWPEGGLAHLHWVHRLVAYGLVLHVVGLAIAYQRRRAAPSLTRAAWITAGLVVAQVLIAVVMVLGGFPALWRVLHAVVGTAVWVALIYLLWRATPTPQPA